MPEPRLAGIRPFRAIPGGRISILGSSLLGSGAAMPAVHVGVSRARVVFASSTQLDILVPAGLDGGPAPVRVESVPGETPLVHVAEPLATGLHQVDSPVFDWEGNLYVTYSGTRGQQVPVSVFRVRPNGTRETFLSGIINATSMAFDPAGRLHVSSRFDGTVYRVADDGTYATFATDLGVACGLCFDADGGLFVGDRSGTIFRLDADGHADAFASLPPSVAAFHLAIGPDRALYVTAPTLSCSDPVYRIDQDGRVTAYREGFGRPQGIAFDSAGALHVIEALAGSSGLYRLESGRPSELIVAGPGLVGVAFDRAGGLVVCTNDTVYRLMA